MAIQRELESQPGLLMASVDVVGNMVEITVILDRDGELQREMDQRYGPGVVEVDSALEPVD